jgi:hypothetical protein
MALTTEEPGSIPDRSKIFFSPESTPVLGLTQPPIQIISVARSPTVKRAEREADHSPPSSGSKPPLSQFSWRGT